MTVFIQELRVHSMSVYHGTSSTKDAKAFRTNFIWTYQISEIKYIKFACDILYPAKLIQSNNVHAPLTVRIDNLTWLVLVMWRFQLINLGNKTCKIRLHSYIAGKLDTIL